MRKQDFGSSTWNYPRRWPQVRHGRVLSPSPPSCASHCSTTGYLLIFAPFLPPTGVREAGTFETSRTPRSDLAGFTGAMAHAPSLALSGKPSHITASTQRTIDEKRSRQHAKKQEEGAGNGRTRKAVQPVPRALLKHHAAFFLCCDLVPRAHHMPGRWARFLFSLGAMSQRHAVGEGSPPSSWWPVSVRCSHRPLPAPRRKGKWAHRKDTCAMEVYNGKREEKSIASCEGNPRARKSPASCEGQEKTIARLLSVDGVVLTGTRRCWELLLGPFGMRATSKGHSCAAGRLA